MASGRRNPILGGECMWWLIAGIAIVAVVGYSIFFVGSEESRREEEALRKINERRRKNGEGIKR